MIEITINTTAVRALMAKLTPEQMGNRTRAAMLESVAYLKTEVQKATPVDRGIGRGSVVSEVNGTGIDLTGRVMSVEAHMAVLELGRRPGARPPPMEPIRSWLGRHGMDEKLAFVVARAIGKRGTKALHMFENAATKGAGTVASIFVRHYRI